MATFKQLDDGTQGQVVLRDYQHAARIFVDSNYRLSPKYNFLFYVEFDFNPLITNLTNTTAQELGMIVKAVSLPKFTIQVKEHNAYNRKNYVQNSIKYDSVNITFHDDQSDNVLNFWYDYYSYYYRDSDYNDATYSAYHKYQSRPTLDWGYSPRPAVGYNSSNAVQPYQYIQAVRIYSMYQQQFDEYELVNPIITNFRHGDLQNGSSEFLHHEMSLQFETVKYYSGYVTQNTVGGFIDLHYDSSNSPYSADSSSPWPNDGTIPEGSGSTAITDFANNQTSINPSLRTDLALQTTAQPATASTAGQINSLLSSLLGGGTNSGGFSIPSLGSLTSGSPSLKQLESSLVSGVVGLAGGAATSLAKGLVGTAGTALASTLGVSAGTAGSIIGLGAAAIANPSAALATAGGMAVQGLTSLASSSLAGALTGSGVAGSTSLSGLASNLGNAMDSLGTSASNLLGEAGTAASNALDSAEAAASSLGTAASDMASSALNSISSTASSLFGSGDDPSDADNWSI